MAKKYSMHPMNPTYATTMAPPVMEARRWIEGKTFPTSRPLINLSQAAPLDPPPAPLAQAMAEAVMTNPATHHYGPVLGLHELRAELAMQWAATYGGTIEPRHVAITAGCNQAFTAVMSSIAGAGDAAILPLPYYFNHKMWLDMTGVHCITLPTDDDLIPDPERAAALIGDKVKAIVLVTPNNPSGAEYPAHIMRAFFDLARDRGVALVVDETYRDFHSLSGAPHDLFTTPDWGDTLIHLYSFSKAYRLPGHRVGAIVANTARLAAVEKFLDTVAICPPMIGQIGALWGLQNLRDWLAAERREILARRAAIMQNMARLSDWQLLGCGAYFAFVRHPFARPSSQIAQDMVGAAGLLTLPGTMFGPTKAQAGTGQAETTLRLAFANVDRAGLADVVNRLEHLDL